MEKQKWIPALLGTLAALVVFQFFLVGGLRRSSSSLESRLSSLEKKASRQSGLASDIESLSDELARIDEDLDDLRAASVYSSGKIKKLDEKAEVSDIEAGISSMFPEIEALIKKKVREEVASSEDSHVGTFTSMSVLAESLALNQYQQQKTAEIFNAAKYEAFQVVTVPRGDGSTILDEFADAILKSENPRQDGMKVLLKLAVDNVPGTDETYFSRLKEIRSDAISEAGEAMTAEQGAKLDSMGINVYGVDTGYNPLTEYFRNALSGVQ